MDAIIQWDQYCFELINQGLRNPFMDWLLPFWREKTFWIPLYIALVGFSIWKFRKKAIYFILGAGLTVGVADTMSSKVIKPLVHRLRPCNDPVFKEEVHLLVRCGSGYSFTSSHASNHFAIALFLIYTLGGVYPIITWPLILWAASISFGQVYVGVHYPLDVLSGAFLGIWIGWGMAKFYNSYKLIKLAQ